MPRAGDHRPRQPLRRRRVPPRGEGARLPGRSSASRRTSRPAADRATGGGPRARSTSFHLTLLARTGEGVRNLMRLSSKSFLEGFYYKPRIDKEILARHSEGLICLSGCASAEFSDLPPPRQDRPRPRSSAPGIRRSSAKRTSTSRSRTTASASSATATQGAVDVARRMGLPLVGHQRRPLPDPRGRPGARRPALHQHGQDARRPEPDEVRDRRVLRPQPRRDVRRDAGPRRGAGARRPGSPSWSSRTTRASASASGCFPSFQPPGREDARGLPPRALRGGAGRALRRRTRPTARRERLEHELGIINRMGFASYFLIVWDFVRFAREAGHPQLGRAARPAGRS